jgi:hypothetical protein
MSRGVYLEVEGLTSRTVSSSDDDDGFHYPPEQIPLLPGVQPIDPANSNFLERYQRENKWLELKTKPIPTTEPDLSEWADEWLNTYREGIRLRIPRFVNDASRMAILDFLAMFKLQNTKTYLLWFINAYTANIEQSEISEQFNFQKILEMFTKFWSDELEYVRKQEEKNKTSLSTSFDDDVNSTLPSQFDRLSVTSREERQAKSLKIYRTGCDWYNTIFRDIPSSRHDLGKWLTKLRIIYCRAVLLEMAEFIDKDSRDAEYGFLYRISHEAGYESIYADCWTDVKDNRDLPSFFAILDRFELEWQRLKDAENQDERKLSDINDVCSTPSSKTNKKPVSTKQKKKKKDNSMEINWIEHQWTVLRFSDIPSTRHELDEWLGRWKRVFDRAVELKIPHFTNDNSKKAIYDFYEPFDWEPGWLAFHDSCWLNVERASQAIPFDAVLARFKREWERKKEATEKKEEEEEARKEQEICVCGMTRHTKWKECFYLNETIRPADWKPRKKVMARIGEQAQNDKKLKNFIRNHRKKQLPPPPPKQEGPKEEEEQDDSQEPIHVLFPIHTELDLQDNVKTKTSFFLLSNTPVHICNDRSRFTTFKQCDPTLPQNKIHSMDKLDTALGIHGVGEVIVKGTAPDGREKAVTFRLGNVKYCPQAPCNAVSIARFKTKGIHFHARTDMLYVIKDGERMDAAKVEFRHNRFMLEYNPVEPMYDVCM